MKKAPTLKIAIVDDEAPARNRLKDLLHDCRDQMPTTLVLEAANGREALDLLQTHPAEVVLLDIRMPVMDGLELAQHLRKLPQPASGAQSPAIIFTTAFDDYAIKAFEVHAVDYLLKPIRAERLLDALERVNARANTALPSLEMLAQLDQINPRARTHLSVHERGRVLLIPVGEIIYLRAELKYTTIVTHAKEHLLEESLVNLEAEFGDTFVRVHRNCLVAINRITGFEKGAPFDGGEARWRVCLNGRDEKLPVSRRQQHIVKEMGRN